MSVNNKNNDLTPLDVEENVNESVETKAAQDKKPHIIRRNIEDHLAARALKKRLTDIFDDDFLLD